MHADPPTRHRRCHATSGVATSRAAAARTPSTTPGSAACSASAARSPRTGTTTRQRAVLEGQLRGPHAEPLRPGAQSARDRRRYSTRDPESRHLRRSRSAARVPRRPDPNCVPYNIFDLSSPARPQDALTYLQAPTLAIGTIDQEIYTGHASPAIWAGSGCRARSPTRASRSRSASSAARTGWSSCPTCCCRRRPSVARAAPSPP